MYSLKANYLKLIQFDQNQASTLKRIGEYKGKQDLFTRQTPEILESLKKVAIIESSESSNRLEGITAEHKRIKDMVLKSTEPKNRSEQEIAGYRDSLNLIHESAKHMDFSVNVIMQIHSMIYRYLPQDGGRYKMTDNEIVEKNPDGSIMRVRFKAVSAVKTPFAMEQMAIGYKQSIYSENLEPLLIIPLTILDFLCIHPFSDGNGRVARLLTLMLLYHFDYEVGRYISLERIFEESKETYYESLEASSQKWHQGKHSPNPWLNYFWGAMLKAYKEFEERVGTIRKSKGSKTDQIIEAVKRKIGPFSISDIERELPTISRDMIRIVLRKLRDEKTIIPQGKGRAAKWINKA
ncbi:MAG: Fic family protein [Pseudomonadota bacterium]